MQAAPSDDMFAGLTTNSSLTPPIGRLTTPTSTIPTTGGVNSTSGLDLSSLATTHLQTTSYQTPPVSCTPLRITSRLSSTISTSPANTSCCCTDTITSSTGRREEGPAGHQLQQEEEEWAGHHLYCSQLQLAPPPTLLILQPSPPTNPVIMDQLVRRRAVYWSSTPTTALEPHPQGSILQPTPLSQPTMGWSSGCQLSTAAGTSYSQHHVVIQCHSISNCCYCHQMDCLLELVA